MTPLFTPQALREQVIRPALLKVNSWMPVWEDILLGVAAQESHLTYVKQLGGGPALGLWQEEPFTHDDIWKNYLAFRAPLAADIRALIGGAQPASALLATNHLYACAMAWVRLVRSHVPLPALGYVPGYAHMWKIGYNTIAGKGTEQEFIDNYKRIVLGVSDA